MRAVDGAAVATEEGVAGPCHLEAGNSLWGTRSASAERIVLHLLLKVLQLLLSNLLLLSLLAFLAFCHLLLPLVE